MNGIRQPVQKEGLIRTARDALLCKESASTFVTKSNSKRQTPLLDRFYHIRSSVLHELFSTSLSCLTTLDDDAVQILVLGAGLDETYEDIVAKQYPSKCISIFNVDFDEIIRERCDRLASRHCNEGDMISVYNINADLRHPIDLFVKLQQNEFKSDRPTLVLVECVLSYLDTVQVQRLLHELSDRLASSEAVMICYDPILPMEKGDEGKYKFNGFSDMMHVKFAERGAPILHSLASAVNNISYFRDNGGWNHVISWNMQQAWISVVSDLNRQFPEAILRTHFDEYASLAMLLRHYSVTLASMSPLLFAAILKKDISNNNCKMHAMSRMRHRLEAAEARIAILEKIFKRRQLCANGMREALNDDSSFIQELYGESLQSVAEKRKAVGKFLKKALSSLVTIERTFSREKKSNFWVFISNGSIVGCVGLKGREDGVKGVVTGELCNLCVHPSHRRKGIAKKLVAKAIEYCHQYDISSVDLTVLNDLDAARSLYLTCGFVEINHDNIGGGCILIHMARHLN